MSSGPTPRRTDTPVIATPVIAAGIGHGAAIIKVTAPWCTSCRALNPIVDEVATRTGVRVIALQPDTDPDQVEHLGVQSIPTLIAVSDGEEVDRLVGLHSAERVTALFEVAVGTRVGVSHRPPPGLLVTRGAAGLAIAAGGALFGSVLLGVVGVGIIGWGVSGAFRR